MSLTQSQIDSLGNIVGDWHFADLSTLTVDGSNNISLVEDQSSAGNDLANATISQQARFVTGAFRGIGGARFGHSGVENYYQLPYPAVTSGTMVAVVRLDNSASTSRTIGAFLIALSAGNANRRNFVLRRDTGSSSDGTISIFTANSSWDSSRQVFGQGQVGVIVWQQSEDSIRATFNGEQIIDTFLVNQSTSIDTLTVGSSDPGGDQWLDGVLLRATAYSDVLSDGDVEALVNAYLQEYVYPVKPGLPVVQPGHPLAANVTAAYLFTEGSGGRITDASGNNNDGVLGKIIGTADSTTTAETSLQGVASDGSHTFQVTELSLFGRVSSNQLNDDPPIQGSPNLNGDCSYLDDLVYVAMSTTPTPVAANAQIAVCDADSAVTQSIIDLSVNGPSDPSGCHAESDGAGGVDVYVSSYDPDEGFFSNGLYHYNIDSLDVVTFQGVLSFQINLPFIRGVSRDTAGNWYFVVHNTGTFGRNYLFRFDGNRNLSGARFLTIPDYFQMKGVDASQSSVLIGYRSNGTTESEYRAFNPATLFDLTGAPWDGPRLNFDESDTDTWFAALPITLGSEGSILAKFNPDTIFSNNSYFASLNNQFDWEGYTNSNGGSLRDAGDVNFRIDTNIRDSAQLGFGDRISVFAYDMTGDEALYINGSLSESGAVAVGAPDHYGLVFLGGLADTGARSDTDYDLVVFFDRDLTLSEVESVSSSGDPFSLFQDPDIVALNGDIQSQGATFDGQVRVGSIIGAEIQSDNAVFEGALIQMVSAYTLSGEVQSEPASFAGGIGATGVPVPEPQSSLQISLDKYVEVDSRK